MSKRKHGMTSFSNGCHPLYYVWRGMRSRCYSKSDESFHTYGAVGVTVCKEWKDDALAFKEWAIANGWEKGYHLDKDILCSQKKISPAIYSPDTCMFVTGSANSKESSIRNKLGHQRKNVRPIAKYSLKGEFIESFKCFQEGAEATGIKGRYITRVASMSPCNSKYKTVGGFKWGYIDEEEINGIQGE